MPIFNTDYIQVWNDLTPPQLRVGLQIPWGEVIMAPLNYQNELMFIDYADGSTYPIYSNASAYTKGDRVVYSGRSVYESFSGSTGVTPTNTNNWFKVNDNYIGVRERSKYNAQKILYEYALNRWFQCSGIYIQNNSLLSGGFLIGSTADFSSPISQSDTPVAGGYIGNGYTANTQTAYTIFVPAVVFSGLGTTTIERVNVVKSFAETVNLAGMIYNVLPY